jgi:glycosyltransferase involved in cell wall biosynthesis
MTPLLVNVIIPVFNGERFLAEAIDSVLAQTYRPLEILIVDDGSTDGSARIARDYAQHESNVLYFRQSNCGPAAARNAGLQHAHGHAIAFLDADDLWTPSKLASQAAALRDSPSGGIVLGRLQRLKLIHSQGFVPHGASELALNLGASLIRRQVFGAVGTFDESLRLADDWDWYMRARELAVSILVQDDVVLFYRRHDDNLTNQRDETDRSTVQILKRSLERRRKRHGEAYSLPPICGSSTWTWDQD